MMGPTSLKEIRERLRYLLSSDGEDPVAWVEKRRAAGRQNSEVLTSILALLKRPDLAKKPWAKPARNGAPLLGEELEAFERLLQEAAKSKHKARPKKPRTAKKR